MLLQNYFDFDDDCEVIGATYDVVGAAVVQ